MISKFIHKPFRPLRRWLKKQRPYYIVIGIILLIGSLAYTTYMLNNRLVVNPTSYTPLLQLIAKAESNNNYNAYFGNAGNTSILFTNMTIAEVMNWQAEYVRQGKASSAVGKYQIIDSTLAGLVRQLGLDTGQRFDEAMQDKLAITLVERRGAEAYINKELPKDEFAANLAKEWAALPKVIGDNPKESYYVSDGLNKSRISIEEIQQAIAAIRSN